MSESKRLKLGDHVTRPIDLTDASRGLMHGVIVAYDGSSWSVLWDGEDKPKSGYLRDHLTVDWPS